MRRPLLVVGLILLLLAVLAFYSWLTSPTHLDYYRLVDDQTLALGIDDAGNLGNHLSGLVETPETVTVTVVALQLTIGPTGLGATPAEVEARLSKPLGSRVVIDGSSGQGLQRAICPPPAVFASPCP